jgi:cytochrome c-type biogenesis protein CcmH
MSLSKTKGPLVVVALAGAGIACAAVVLIVGIERTPVAPAAMPANHAPVAAAARPGGAATLPPVAELTERLARKLATDGGTADQWSLLARSYEETGRRDEAIAAYRRALALDPANADNAAALARVGAR